MLLSIIIPVYDRPDEINELLSSLVSQTRTEFEVIVVEDGSQDKCEDIVEKYKSHLTVNYYYKENTGPGTTRNYGALKSSGDYLIFLDSDCILPKQYIEEIFIELNSKNVDAFGGPDKADISFTHIQKAINYAMTSFLTTGGIRGGKCTTSRLDKFYPRSFNMGIKKTVFEALDGFSVMRFGEDIDLSLRIHKNGYNSYLFSKAWVYHKRRTNLKQFFKQVYNFGIARIVLYKKYPESLKFVHLLPAAFTVGTCILLILSFLFYPLFLLLIFYAILVFTDASIKNKSVKVGLLAIAASFVQLCGYGSGFILGWWNICIRKQKKYFAFEKNFYK